MQTEQPVYFWTFIKLKIERHWFFIKMPLYLFKSMQTKTEQAFLS